MYFMTVLISDAGLSSRRHELLTHEHGTAQPSHTLEFIKSKATWQWLKEIR